MFCSFAVDPQLELRYPNAFRTAAVCQKVHVFEVAAYGTSFPNRKC